VTADEAIETIQRAARGVAPSELFAAAVGDGCTVQIKKYGRAEPLAKACADGDALLAAVLRGDDWAVAAAMRALARLDGEAMLEPALALHEQGSGAVGFAAGFALAHSRDDAALAAVLGALDDRAPRGALDRSVHPDATARVREALARTGVTVFEVRPRPTLAEWKELAPDERRAVSAMQPRGAPSRELARAQAAIGVLGARQDVESVELLVRLFENHPDDRLRIACAHALARLRDPRAAAALDRRWADADSTVSTIAVRGSLIRDLATAWDRFAPHLQPVLDGSASAIDEQIVGTLFYVCHGGMTPRDFDPDPLRVEPRFVDLAARLRRHRFLGSWSRRVLEVVPRDEVAAAIARHPYVAPVVAPVALPARRDFVARYLAGERGVWGELVEHAVAIAQHAELRAEAYAVAEQLMRRVRHNVDAIRTTLREAGAHVADDDPPPSDAELARVVALGGPLPIALEAFWRVVGSAVLTPDGADRYAYGKCALEADGLALIALDPLEIRGDVSYCLDEHAQRVAETHPELVGPLSLELSPDHLHKQNISGGGPHTIELPPQEPADAVDPPLLYTRYRSRLVDYLRLAFRFGGFPGLDVAHLPVDRIHVNDRIAFKRVSGAWGDAADRLLAKLRRDLVEL